MDDQNKNPVTDQPLIPQPNVSEEMTPSAAPLVSPPQPVAFNPPSSSVEQPVVVGVSDDVQGPAVMYQNDSYKVSDTRRLSLRIIVMGISSLVFLIAIILYLLVLPSVWSSSYIKNITPLYQDQASQIKAVYQSLGRPVFTSSSSSAASNSQDLKYITNVLETATKNTDSLKAKDHLTQLPGTSWQHTVSKTNSEYQAMQQYTSGSLTFLEDYKTLVVYVEQTDQIAQVQLPPLINDFNIIYKGNTTAAFIVDLQNTITNLQSFISQVQGLKPPADLSEFNQNLLTELNGMNEGLQGQESDLQSNNMSNFTTSQAVYVTAFKDFVNLLSSNPTANIQTNSTIHNQIVTLEGEHPLQ